MQRLLGATFSWGPESCCSNTYVKMKATAARIPANAQTLPRYPVEVPIAERMKAVNQNIAFAFALAHLWYRRVHCAAFS